MNALAAIALGLTMLAAACTTATPSGPQILDVRGVWIGDWEFEPASAGRGIFSMTLDAERHGRRGRRPAHRAGTEPARPPSPACVERR